MALSMLWRTSSTIAHKLRCVSISLFFGGIVIVQTSLCLVLDWCLFLFVKKLTSFEYVEPNGKDVGLNVRKKAETVLAIIDDREKLQQVREKAAATRDKWGIHGWLTVAMQAATLMATISHLHMHHMCRYFGLSSTGITYKSSAASFGSGSFSSGSYYGSTGSSKDEA